MERCTPSRRRRALRPCDACEEGLRADPVGSAGRRGRCRAGCGRSRRPWRGRLAARASGGRHGPLPAHAGCDPRARQNVVGRDRCRRLQAEALCDLLERRPIEALSSASTRDRSERRPRQPSTAVVVFGFEATQLGSQQLQIAFELGRRQFAGRTAASPRIVDGSSTVGRRQRAGSLRLPTRLLTLARRRRAPDDLLETDARRYRRR